ncbi:fumarylacetoacetate hydrolase family protein, partial [bacterium]|nr:fumarylacetoacetate hydrolase family protein [bacterium]
LEPMDIIATGTPEGVGPMNDGDVIEAGIEGIGKLTFRAEKEK